MAIMRFATQIDACAMGDEMFSCAEYKKWFKTQDARLTPSAASANRQRAYVHNNRNNPIKKKRPTQVLCFFFLKNWATMFFVCFLWCHSAVKNGASMLLLILPLMLLLILPLMLLLILPLSRLCAEEVWQKPIPYLLLGESKLVVLQLIPCSAELCAPLVQAHDVSK